VTRCRCDGIFNESFIANLQEIATVKIGHVFDEVILKILLVPFFPRTRCIKSHINHSIVT